MVLPKAILVMIVPQSVLKFQSIEGFIQRFADSYELLDTPTGMHSGYKAFHLGGSRVLKGHDIRFSLKADGGMTESKLGRVENIVALIGDHEEFWLGIRV